MAADTGVTLPFTFNGKEFAYGRLRFSVDSMACVEGFDLGVPAKYALKLLGGDGDAWRLLEATAKAPLLGEVKTKLLELAFNEGPTSAWKTLGIYVENAPNGKPRFYRPQYGNHRVDLTDGSTGVSFYLCNDLRGAVSRLPVNVYCETKGIRRFELNLNLYTQASAQIDDFFKFTCRIADVSHYATISRVERCMRTYFSNRAEAYKLLAEMERDAVRRRERDAFWNRLEREQAVGCAGGIIVRYGAAAYYVTGNGQVLEFFQRDAELRESVYCAYKRGKPPKQVSEVADPDVLRKVAEAVAKLRPELAIVIAP